MEAFLILIFRGVVLASVSFSGTIGAMFAVYKLTGGRLTFREWFNAMFNL